MAKGEGKVVAQNKKARHDYTIVDTIEAGMVLTGTEIKSVRAARINFERWLCTSKNGEVWLSNVHCPLRGRQYLESRSRPSSQAPSS